MTIHKRSMLPLLAGLVLLVLSCGNSAVGIRHTRKGRMARVRVLDPERGFQTGLPG